MVAQQIEREKLYHIFQRNGYSHNIVHRYSMDDKRIHIDPKAQQRRRVVLPYIRNLSEVIARILQPLGIQVAHKPTSTLRTAFSTSKQPRKAIDRCEIS